MPDEARLVDDGNGLHPDEEGWFVVDARDAQWAGNATNGRYVTFDSRGANWPDLGFGIHVLEPGQPMARYHGEENRELFLIVSGEALLLVEGEERPLREWDLVHCAPWTEHILVGGGDGPCAIVCASPRRPASKIRYPANELAHRYGASAPHDTEDPAEAYADVERPSPRRYRDGDLPDL